LDNADNAGIEQTIDALSGVVERHATEKSGLSRADIWALSSIVGTDVSQPDDSRIDFRMNWWGRVDCEKTGEACIGEDGAAVECSAKKGPHHEFPNNNMKTDEVYGFFEDNFGFDQRDTIAIMGAHTLGVAREEVRRKPYRACLSSHGNAHSLTTPFDCHRISTLTDRMDGF
jgi:Peroxidase